MQPLIPADTPYPLSEDRRWFWNGYAWVPARKGRWIWVGSGWRPSPPLGNVWISAAISAGIGLVGYVVGSIALGLGLFIAVYSNSVALLIAIGLVTVAALFGAGFFLGWLNPRRWLLGALIMNWPLCLWLITVVGSVGSAPPRSPSLYGDVSGHWIEIVELGGICLVFIGIAALGSRTAAWLIWRSPPHQAN